MAETSKGGKKKTDDKAIVSSTRAKRKPVVSGSPKEGIKDVGSGRTKGAEAARSSASKNSPSQARLSGPKTGGTSVATIRSQSPAPRAAAPSSANLPAVRNGPGTQVGGISGKIAPRHPGTLQTTGSASGAAYPDMTAGQRQQGSSSDINLLSAVGKVLARWAGPAAAAASVMAPSPTNQGEAEWIAAGRPAQGMGGNVQSQGSMGGGAMAGPMYGGPPGGSMGMGSSAPRPSAGGGMGATAANALQSSMGGTMGRPSAPGSMTGQAPQQGSMGGGQAPMRRPPNGSQPVGGQQRPRQSVPTTGPDPMSIDAKIAQLVQKGFSREDALKLASAQGGKVNAPQGYARGGMVKAPGMPRMPKTPDTGKKGTATKVMPAISKAMKPKAPKKVK